MSSLSLRKVVLGVVAAASSYIVGGAILDSVSNAIAQINWSVTVTGTIVLVLSWITLRFILKKHPFQWKNYRVTRLGYYPACTFVGIILLLWTPPIVNQFNYASKQPLQVNPPPKKEATIVVLVSEFAGGDPHAYGVTQIIFEQLSDAVKDYPDVRIKHLPQNLDSSESAQTKGKELQADIVLWGAYLVNQANTRVTVHFEVIDKVFDLPLLEDKEVISAKTPKLESFVLQEQLSKEMSYLILLTTGIARLEALDFDGAIASFSKALSLSTFPDQLIEPHHLYGYRATCYTLKGALDQAASDYSRALSYKRSADLLSMRGSVYALQGKTPQALNDLTESLGIKPDDEVYGIRGFVYMHLTDHPQLAVADFNKAIALNPRNINVHLDRGSMYFQQGDFGSALADVNKAIELEPENATAYSNRGAMYERKGNIEKALADYSKAIEVDPDDSNPYYNRAALYAMHGQPDRAMADINISLGIDPTPARAYNIRGLVYLDKGELDKAISDFTAAIEIGSDNSYGYYFNRGKTYHLKGEFDRAIEDYTEAAKLNPDYAEAYGRRGDAYLSKQNFDLAIADSDRAIKLNPNNSEYYNIRGAAYALKKQFPPAMKDFEKAIALDNRAIAAYFNRGTAYAEQGQENDAIADFRKVLELGSNEDVVSHAKRKLCKLGKGECQ